MRNIFEHLPVNFYCQIRHLHIDAQKKVRGGGNFPPPSHHLCHNLAIFPGVIWGITKEILLNSAEDRTLHKNITRSQTTQNIGLY